MTQNQENRQALRIHIREFQKLLDNNSLEIDDITLDVARNVQTPPSTAQYVLCVRVKKKPDLKIEPAD